MGSTDFDEYMERVQERRQAEMLAAHMEKQLRAVIRFGTRGNCPPGSHCRRGVTGDCQKCWLAFAGLQPLPDGEREREDSEDR